MEQKIEQPLESALEPIQSLEANASIRRRIDTFWTPAEDALDAEKGRAIGHDFARLRMSLPEHAERAVVEGFTSAKHSQSRSMRNVNNQREAADPGVRKLMRLRYSAWRRNRIVDDSVTPKFLNLIRVDYCPITRVEMTHGTLLDTDATIDRVFNDGAYAVGNLVFLSQKANYAKANRLPNEVSEIARSGLDFEGLTTAEWNRMACLCEMSSPYKTNDEIWPLLLIPPNGLMITNPLVMIMEFLSVLACGMIDKKLYVPSRNVFSGKKEKRAFDNFLAAYGGRSCAMACVQGELLRQRMGDLWGEKAMWNEFLKLLKHLDEEKIKALSTIAERAFYGELVHVRSRELVEKSWHLETRGYEISQ